MIFRRGKKTVSKNIGKMDKLVTGIIITGAAASIIGISRTKRGKSITQNVFSGLTSWGKIGLGGFGKVSTKLLSLFQKHK